MIPLDKLSRSHFDIYKIPDTSSRIYNTKSLCLTLVQVTPQHFIPTWDEVDFQKIEALSCVQFVHKHKAQSFNFYTNYVEVLFIFLFPTFLTLCQVGTKFFTQLGMKLYPSIATFVTCGRIAHKPSRQFVGKWIATHQINNQGQLLPCFHFFVYGKLNFYANCAEVSK